MKTVLGFAVIASLFVSGCLRPGRGVDETDRSRMSGDRVSAGVESAGQALPIYRKDGESWIQATSGNTYQLVLENPGTTRIEVVVSVDGLNVISGQPADYKTQRGYVLMPAERLVIPGFRTSLESVAAFEFAPVEQSYAAAVDTADNVGLIGFAVFEEAPRETRTAHIAQDSAAPAAVADQQGRVLSTGQGRLEESNKAVARDDHAQEVAESESTTRLGTGFGQPVESQAQIVPFVRQNRDTPIELIVLRYADEATLRALGIIVTPTTTPTPDPFPGTGKNPAFAQPPQ